MNPGYTLDKVLKKLCGLIVTDQLTKDSLRCSTTWNNITDLELIRHALSLGLLFAVQERKMQSIKVLLGWGADVCIQDNRIIRKAMYSGDVEITKFLIEEVGVNPSYITPQTIYIVEKKGLLPMADYLRSIYNHGAS